jgi:hypothetical protein
MTMRRFTERLKTLDDNFCGEHRMDIVCYAGFSIMICTLCPRCNPAFRKWMRLPYTIPEALEFQKREVKGMCYICMNGPIMPYKWTTMFGGPCSYCFDKIKKSRDLLVKKVLLIRAISEAYLLPELAQCIEAPLSLQRVICAD